MSLFCQYETRVFPTPERWSEFGPRTEAKLTRRRLRKRRHERWDLEYSGPGAEREIAEWIQADEFLFPEWNYLGVWPEEWRIGTGAP